MKKVLVACAIMLATIVSYAQNTTTVNPNRIPPKPAKTEAEKKQELETFITKLNATSEQATKIRSIYNEFVADKAKLESLKTTDANAYKAKIRTVGEGYARKVKALLTPEQQKTFDAIIAEREKN